MVYDFVSCRPPLGRDVGNDSNSQTDVYLSKEIKKMPIKECSEKLKSNLIQAVGLFQYRVESFFTHYITGSSNPVG